MWRSRFLWQLYLGFVGLILATTVAVGVLLVGQVEKDTLNDARGTLRRTALLLREVALPRLKGPVEGAVERVEKAGEELGVRWTVIDVDGVVLVDSRETASEMDNHGRRPEVLRAKRLGTGQSSRHSATLGVDMMYYAIAVRGNDDQLLGYVRSALALVILEERLARLRFQLIVGAMIAAGLALAVSFFFSQRITKRLTTLTSAANSIAQGNYNDRVQASSRDEIGELGRSFNSMAQQLSERIEATSRDENKVVTILSGMIEGVVAVDRVGRVLHMNDAAADILNVSQKSSEGLHLYEVTRVRDVSELLRDTLRDGRERREEFTVEGVGASRSIEAYASPLRDGSGGLAGGVIILHDVTDVRRLEAVRRDFVANVSHELKTPVTAIRGLVETLLETDDMDEGTQDRFLGRVKNQSIRLAELVSDLLTLSRVESRRGGHLERECFDLRERVLDSERRALGVAEEKGVLLESTITREPTPVLGDQEGMQKIVDNLLDNAIKYTPTGGAVKLRVFTEKGQAVLEVDDTGLGIETEHLERIFERFYRVDKARSRELGGTGLGLSIVKHFVGALNGGITVDSEPGRGSIFRVELPIHEEDSADS